MASTSSRRVADTKRTRARSVQPIALSPAVSAQMQRMPRESSTPEVLLRRALHALGLRFRLHDRRLPGTPDIVFPRARLAVFVDGCFWHACPEHGTLPRNNREWWAAKLAATTERDRRKDAALGEIGWQPVHVWEHTDVTAAAEEIRDLWRTRTLLAGGGAP